MSNPDISQYGEATRFKPGESGNPNGRPKGKKNLKTVLVELLSSQDPDGEWAKSVAGQLIRKAFRDGDMRALQEIIDRIDGKVAQKIEGQANPDTKIYIVRDKADGNTTQAVSRSLPFQH